MRNSGRSDEGVFPLTNAADQALGLEGQTRRLLLSLLGAFSLRTSDGSPITISGKKNRALLAILAMAPDQSVMRERLCTLLWGDHGDEQARNNLRQSLSVLRKELGPEHSAVLSSQDDRLALDISLVSVDALDVIKAADQEEITQLRAGVAAYKGSLMSDIGGLGEAFEEWLTLERQRLHRASVRILERLVDTEPGERRIAAAQQLVQLDPLREASHRALMRAHAEMGDNGSALRQFEICRDLLRNELGVEPSRETMELRNQITGQAAKPPDHQPLLHPPNSAPHANCRLAVLPFVNMSGDPEQEYFADGLTEDLLIELARRRRLTVASRHSCFLYKGKPVDAREVGEKLAVDFIVEGSVRKSGERIRITAQLIDAKSGTQVSSNRYDRPLNDVFALQDEIVTTILGGLSFNLDETASNQKRRDPTASMSAYGAFLQARTDFWRGNEAKAVEYLRRAIELDPDFARAMAQLSWQLALSRFSFTSELSDEALLAEANALSERALAADRYDPFVLGYLASAHSMLGNLRKAKQLADAAYEICPRDPEIMHKRGYVMVFCGQHKEGVALMEAAFALESHLPPQSMMALAEGRYMNRDYPGALEPIDRLMDIQPAEYMTFAAAYGQLGRVEEAKAMVAHAVAKSLPSFDPAQWARNQAQVCVRSSDAEHWLEGLRKAGVGV